MAGTLPSRRKRFALIAGTAAILTEAVAVVRRGYPPAGRVAVRCRDGHVFSTLWIPGASIKSLRLGPWRLQWCPVGRHISVVTPVRRSDLTPRQRRAASRRSDAPVP